MMGLYTKEIGDLLQYPSCGESVSDSKERYLCFVYNKRYPVVDRSIDLQLG
jgi:hypothetical protein